MVQRCLLKPPSPVAGVTPYQPFRLIGIVQLSPSPSSLILQSGLCLTPTSTSDHPHLVGNPEAGGCAYYHHCSDPQFDSWFLLQSTNSMSRTAGGPRGQRKGVLIVHWGRRASCPKRHGAKCSGLQEVPTFQWDGVREGTGEEVALQEARRAYEKA